MRSSLKYLEDEILGRVARVQSSCPHLIIPSIDVQEEYELYRSFCRGSNSEALNRGFSKVTNTGER